MTHLAVVPLTEDELIEIKNALWSMEAECCLNPAGYTAMSKIVVGIVLFEESRTKPLTDR